MADSAARRAIVRAARKVMRPEQRGMLRMWRARVDNVELRWARRLIKRLETSPPPDVLYLSDSLGQYVDPDDPDQRSLTQMMQEELGEEIDVFTVVSAGYHPQVYEAFLRLVARTPARPLVLHSLWMRGWFPMAYEHPVWGHRESVEALRRLDPSGPVWRMRARKRKPTPERWEEFENIVHPTVLGDLTVGEYRRRLKSGSLSPEEHLRTFYAYWYTAEQTEEYSNIDVVTQLGRRLRELGCRQVMFQIPIPVKTGVEIFGQEFAERLDRNWQLLAEAYCEGLGRKATILETASLFEPSEFLDPAVDPEHLTDSGRRRMAPMIAEAVKHELERD